MVYLQSRCIAGAIVAFDAIDLSVHDVLEAIRARRGRVHRIPFAVVRIAVLSERRSDQHAKFVTFDISKAR